MSTHRGWAIGGVALFAAGAGCQLLSGLSDLHVDDHGGTGGMAGATSSGSTSTSTSSATTTSSGTGATTTSSGTGGATTSSGTGGATTSSGTGGATTSTTGSTTSSTSTTSSGACTTGTSTHCAFCGNDCGGGTCLSNECSSYSPAVAGSNVTALAADGTTIYVGAGVNGSLLQSAPIASGSNFTTHITLATGTKVEDIALVPGTGQVQWIESTGTETSIRTATTSFASPMVVLTLPGNEHPKQLRARGGYVYWARNTGFEKVFSGMTATAIVPVTNMAYYNPFAVDGQSLMWGAGTIVYFTGLGGGAGTSKDVGEPISAFDADDVTSGYVYWISGGSPPAISRYPKAGGTIGNVESPLNGAVGRLLVTNKHVYWTEPEAATSGCTGTWMIRRRRTTDLGGLETVATALTPCPVLAQDALAVYWNNAAAVFRRVKP